MQMPLALLALAMYIKMNDCIVPAAPAHLAMGVHGQPVTNGVSAGGTGPEPLCYAPIILAAILTAMEVRVLPSHLWTFAFVLHAERLPCRRTVLVTSNTSVGQDALDFYMISTWQSTRSSFSAFHGVSFSLRV
jgi:hypothetical protein